MAAPERLYVVKKDMERNTVTLGPESALYSRELYADELNWISVPGLQRPLHCMAKIRYRQTEQPVTVYPAEGVCVRVVFDEPQRAIIAGQAVVFYDGDTVIGGGTIREA